MPPSKILVSDGLGGFWEKTDVHGIPEQILTEPAEYLQFWREFMGRLIFVGWAVFGALVLVLAGLVRVAQLLERLVSGKN